MTLQVLVATMHQNDHSLAQKMNLQSDAIVANQCDHVGYESYQHHDHTIQMYSFAERGIGLNRNNALMRATADLCLLADDDVIYYDGYAQSVVQCFNDYPKVDVLIFNCDEPGSPRFKITQPMKIGFHNYMRFGAVRIAFRREVILKKGIFFNVLFGGKTRYRGGEDTLFLNQCLKHGCKVMALPISIGQLDQTRESTWFTGYDRGFYFDRGALFAALSPRWARVLSLQYILRRAKTFNSDLSLKEAYSAMLEGIKDFKG